jgi:L-fuculose-phosphate aldolase
MCVNCIYDFAGQDELMNLFLLCVCAAEVGAGPAGVLVDEAVERAKRQTAAMPEQGWPPLLKMALAARILGDEGHGDTLAGQITCRSTIDGAGAMWTGRYGVLLGEMTQADFLLVDGALRVRRGQGFPNMATRFHMHIYEQRPEVECVVHTHPPASSALAITGKSPTIEHMDVMGLYDDVGFLEHWPGIPFGDEEGELIAGVLAPNRSAALLAHHGLVVTGRTLDEAVYRAWFFERAARMQLDALSVAGSEPLPTVRRDIAIKAREWRLNAGPVRAHFDAWARRVLRAPAHRDLLDESRVSMNPSRDEL